ncbi:MAG: hypothetical protein H6Q68_1022 [Firmicutes bacterium]|nr:hypothetical protein [Bacillota bacterium]
MAIAKEKPKYAATYLLGNTVVHVIAPPPMTEAKKEKILRELQQSEWEAWNLMPVEERLKANADWAAEYAG